MTVVYNVYTNDVTMTTTSMTIVDGSRRSFSFEWTVQTFDKDVSIKWPDNVRYAVWHVCPPENDLRHVVLRGYIEFKGTSRPPYKHMPGAVFLHVPGTRVEIRESILHSDKSSDGPFQYGTWEPVLGGRPKKTNKPRRPTNHNTNVVQSNDQSKDNDVQAKLERLEEENQKLREDLTKLMQQSQQPSSSTTTIINNYYNCTNGTTNNINISDLGSEDMSHLTDERRRELLLQTRHGFLSFVKDLHFNPSRPQNYNFRIHSKKRKIGLIRKNGEWKRCGLSDTIQTALDVTKAQFLQPLSDEQYMDVLFAHHEPVVEWCQKFMAKHQSVWRPLVTNVRTEMEKAYDDDRKQASSNL